MKESKNQKSGTKCNSKKNDKSILTPVFLNKYQEKEFSKAYQKNIGNKKRLTLEDDFER